MTKSFNIFIIFMAIVAEFSYSETVKLEVLALYNREFEINNTNPALYINSQLDYANIAYQRSNMDIQLELVHHQRLELNKGSVVSEALVSELKTSSQVMNVRDNYAPDLTIYFTRSSDDWCGFAEFPVLNGIAGRTVPSITTVYSGTAAVSTVGWDCNETVTAHEIGHNLGGGHGPVDRSYDILGGLFEYTESLHEGFPIKNSKGHGYYNFYRTIMAYPDKFGDAPRIQRFSSPEVIFNGVPTGTSARDNVSGMTLIAKHIVQFNSDCYPLPYITTTNKWGVSTTTKSTICKNGYHSLSGSNSSSSSGGASTCVKNKWGKCI